MKRSRSEEKAFPLSPALGFLRELWRLNHAIERLSKKMEASYGITAQQRMIIRLVGKYPGMTAGQLAEQLHLDPGTISAAIRRLEGKGLLSRRSDTRDRRRVALGLTASGRALDRPATGTVEWAVESILEKSPSEDIEATACVLGRVVTGIEAEIERLEGLADTRIHK
jgi:MarR family transcriptional regulator, organic hydroperoxide resistance regulator